MVKIHCSLLTDSLKFMWAASYKNNGRICNTRRQRSLRIATRGVKDHAVITWHVVSSSLMLFSQTAQYELFPFLSLIRRPPQATEGHFHVGWMFLLFLVDLPAVEKPSSSERLRFCLAGLHFRMADMVVVSWDVAWGGRVAALGESHTVSETFKPETAEVQQTSVKN